MEKEKKPLTGTARLYLNYLIRTGVYRTDIHYLDKDGKGWTSNWNTNLHRDALYEQYTYQHVVKQLNDKWKKLTPEQKLLAKDEEEVEAIIKRAYRNSK